jgi:hypothetical protein
MLPGVKQPTEALSLATAKTRLPTSLTQTKEKCARLTIVDPTLHCLCKEGVFDLDAVSDTSPMTRALLFMLSQPSASQRRFSVR